MKLTNAMIFVAALASSAWGVALDARSAQDVFVPTITSPTASTTWVVGTTVSVTWETDNAPAHLTNPIGQVQLDFKNGVVTPVVLAEGFSILDGSVSFVVPNVINGTYKIQLFGDASNFSPVFTITGSNSQF